MKDFSSYGSGKKPDKAQEDFMKEAGRIASGYNGRNENDLVREIYARAAEGKKNGTLSNAEIDAFYRQIAPMLDGAKRKKLDKLVAKLKEM